MGAVGGSFGSYLAGKTIRGITSSFYILLKMSVNQHAWQDVNCCSQSMIF